MEIEDMVWDCSGIEAIVFCFVQEKTLSVLEFGVYFNKVVEMKDLLLDELTSVCTKIRKQVRLGMQLPILTQLCPGC